MICQNKKYSNNIICRRLDKNSGSGGKPRNIGIDLAEGKYLMFADADDYFAKDAFENMQKYFPVLYKFHDEFL